MEKRVLAFLLPLLSLGLASCEGNASSGLDSGEGTSTETSPSSSQESSKEVSLQGEELKLALLSSLQAEEATYLGRYSEYSYNSALSTWVIDPLAEAEYRIYYARDRHYVKEETVSYSLTTDYWKGEGGNAVVRYVDPYANEVKETPLTDYFTGETVAFDELYSNPYPLLTSDDLLVDDEDPYSFSIDPECELLPSLGMWVSGDWLSSNRVEITANRDGSIKAMTLVEESETDRALIAITPSDKESLGIEDPSPYEVGEVDDLMAVLERLQSLNYTATTSSLSSDPTNYPEYDGTVVSDGETVWIEGTYGEQKAQVGYTLTEDGLLPFDEDGEGGYKATRPAYVGMGLADIIADFAFHPAMYVDNGDGTYGVRDCTLDYIYSLLPENAMIDLRPDEGTLRIAITDDGLTITYSQTVDSEGLVDYEVTTTITDIGTTPSPIGDIVIAPYDPQESWEDVEMALELFSAYGFDAALIPFYNEDGLGEWGVYSDYYGYTLGYSLFDSEGAEAAYEAYLGLLEGLGWAYQGDNYGEAIYALSHNGVDYLIGVSSTDQTAILIYLYSATTQTAIGDYIATAFATSPNATVNATISFIYYEAEVDMDTYEVNLVGEEQTELTEAEVLFDEQACRQTLDGESYYYVNTPSGSYAAYGDGEVFDSAVGMDYWEYYVNSPLDLAAYASFVDNGDGTYSGDVNATNVLAWMLGFDLSEDNPVSSWTLDEDSGVISGQVVSERTLYYNSTQTGYLYGYYSIDFEITAIGETVVSLPF